MIGFINNFFYNLSQSQLITRIHNKSSAEPLFLYCRELSSFQFSFYGSDLIRFYILM
jgi:hypothetical protein